MSTLFTGASVDMEGAMVGSKVEIEGEAVGTNVLSRILGAAVDTYSVGSGVVGGRVRSGLALDQVTLLMSVSQPVVVITFTVLNVELSSSGAVGSYVVSSIVGDPVNSSNVGEAVSSSNVGDPVNSSIVGARVGVSVSRNVGEADG